MWTSSAGMSSDELERSPLRKVTMTGNGVRTPATADHNVVDGYLPEERTSGKVTQNQPERLSSNERFWDEGDTFLTNAHTVTALVIFVCVVCYEALIKAPSGEGDAESNHRQGIYAVIGVFLAVGTINMPDGPFKRPHPYIWRLFFCISIIYLLGLIYLLFQDVDTARQLMTIYDPALGKPLEEQTYAENCSIYTPNNPHGSFANFMEKMDVFVPSHFFGWYVKINDSRSVSSFMTASSVALQQKALIIRDAWLLNIISVGFELLEYTFECQLPNFGECWWDHWLLDFLICNGLGIYLGMKTCQYLSMKTYHWRNVWKIPSVRGKIKRAVGQFTPYNWTNFQWGYTQSFKRFMFVFIIIVLWLNQEMNTFYLKAILWIPPNHYLNLYRLMIYAPIGAVGMREMYHFLNSNDPNAIIGRQCWVVFAMLCVETLIVIKFGWEIITIPVPVHFKWGWVIFFTAIFIWAAWKFTVPFKDMPFIGPYYRRYIKKEK